MRMRALMILCMVPVVLLFGGCSKSNPAGGNNNTTYYTLTVTLQPPAGLGKKAYLKQVASSGAAGKTAYLKLVSSGGTAASPALYSASVVFPDTGNASVSIDSIASGTYHRYMFIDMDGDAAATGYMPDSGDYRADSGIAVTANVNKTVTTSDWGTAIPPVNAASGYYLPLRVGNYLKFYTPGGDSGWCARTTTYSIKVSDSLSGHEYFLENGTEYPDDIACGDSSVFQLIWLRKDSVGNVVVGAVSNGSLNIDSATVFNLNMFPNEYLMQGYSRTYIAGRSCHDSVLSVSATVSVPAGTFTNCIEISETHFDSTGTVIIYREYHYYAYGIGMVKNIRTLPDIDAHTDELMEYVATPVN